MQLLCAGRRLLTTTVSLTLIVLAAAAQEPAESHALGEPRTDLERFFGLYGNPDDTLRSFFVSEAELGPDFERELPPGYMMIGPMWADVAPYYMKSVSETEFEQQWVSEFQKEPLVAVFEVSEDGKAVALTFKTIFDDKGRLERLKDLPERWR